MGNYFVAPATTQPPATTAGSNLSSDEDEQISDNSQMPHLTPDVWALVLPFMPYRDNLQCAAVNRSFLHDVAPRVKQITVLSAEEMNEKAARTLRRFPTVENVTIACLLRKVRIMHDGDRYGEYTEDEEDFEVDAKVAGLVVPFLSLFPALELARVGAFIGPLSDEFSDEFVHYFELRYRSTLYRGNRCKQDQMAMLALRTSICGAYRFGSIPPGASVRAGYGHCPCERATSCNRDANPACHLCAECIETFPMKQAISMQVACSCLSAITMLKIVLARPGGRDFVTEPSNFFLFHWPIIKAMKDLKLIPTVSRRAVLKLKAQGMMMGERYYGDILALEEAGIPVDYSDYDKVTVD